MQWRFLLRFLYLSEYEETKRFFEIISITALGLLSNVRCKAESKSETNSKTNSDANSGSKTIVNIMSTTSPVVIATWGHGVPANKKAMEILISGGTALDAVEQGVMVVEADPNVTTVGIGGSPNREGKVTLDACVMNESILAL